MGDEKNDAETANFMKLFFEDQSGEKSKDTKKNANTKEETAKKAENSEKVASDIRKADSQEEKDKLDESFSRYPERRSNLEKYTFSSLLFGSDARRNRHRRKCEKNVYKCVQNSPLLKLMIAALSSSGCSFDLRRHIACEECGPEVTGGYDTEMNQIVVCQNRLFSSGKVQGTLAHEMIHMFDICRNYVDLSNLDHLACTEIRAANLVHCSFMSAMIQGVASPFDFRKAHEMCVKKKAAETIMLVRKISLSEALEPIDRVFDRCYNDLEPIGRRIRRNSDDMRKAYEERYLYGYV
ncbi:hypothetical protein KM043_008972 [Ampulex compressa]|nr:hypothetical protein KM043_008972 [Ampulex compressa]